MDELLNETYKVITVYWSMVQPETFIEKNPISILNVSIKHLWSIKMSFMKRIWFKMMIRVLFDVMISLFASLFT